MKLLFVIASLECGGAQRVMTTLARYWAERGRDVTIATFDDGTTLPFFPLGPSVRHVTLDLAKASKGVVDAVRNNVRRIRRIRSLLVEERPHCVVTFVDATNVTVLLAARATGIPVVVAERVDPAQHRIPRAWRLLRRLVYGKASAIAVQTKSISEFFPETWRSRVVVIPNPVEKIPGVSPEPPKEPRARRTILAMGRLERQKGFDLLIQAFAPVARARPNWDLTILGEGSERRALDAATVKAGLEGRVAMPGHDPDAMGALRRADLFVLSSRYEGFPNALCEAMACGLPVISFDCRSGPAEIVRDGVDGVLVPAGDVGGLSTAMAHLIDDPEARRRMGARATEISDRFSIERIASLWESIVEEAITKKG